MKSVLVFFVLLAGGAVAKQQDTPVTRVVTLLTELKAKVEDDGSKEQTSYDKYACWCEDTLGRKAEDISTGKDTIEKLDHSIQELNAALGALASDIENTKKLIQGNLASQAEAKEMREKEHAEYNEEKTESEQCIGALEAAIKVLTGAGTGKKGFLETLQETQLLSVVAGVRSVLGQSIVSQKASGEDLQLVHRFVENPEQFLPGQTTGTVGLSQIAQNPFGDYAPQSTQIQGILKGMYDSFTGDLEKANAEEADQEKAFQDLMATKKQELKTLKATLNSANLAQAEKTEALTTSQTDRADAKTQLAADEEFFADTKEACKSKADEWNTRTRLRTEELQSMAKAIQILSSGSVTFEAATGNSFLQTGRSSTEEDHRRGALKVVRGLAARFHNPNLAQIAVGLKSGGHFDKIIELIDTMLVRLRAEEQADVMHRDKCQGAENKNTNNMADHEHDMNKDTATLARLGNEEQLLQADLEDINMQINMTIMSMDMARSLRTQEEAEFRKSVLDDTQAIELLEQAIVALSNFYKNNGLALDLTQKKVSLHQSEDPSYTVDQDKAPDMIWDDANYGGRKSETSGVVAILSMIKEDLEKEIQTSRAEEAESQAMYEKSVGSMAKALAAAKATKVQYETQLGELGMKISDTNQEKEASANDLAAEQVMKDAIYKDCSWVATHFDSRAEKRKAEIQGLQEAKSYLARGSGDVPFDESLD
mmetsp:Transcript_55147/g.129110  ORF Transcript_55147/g.129110 Transcript_55147/m.129110 type:complete len:710 (-) Transcript_55147:43-2172(-)